MPIHIKNIANQPQFHERVVDLKKISDANDQQLTTKLQGKKGNLDGRLVTFLKKILSLLPGIHLARTNPLEVAKTIEQFAVDYHKKRFLTEDDQAILVQIVEKLKITGKKYSKESAINKVVDRINNLPTAINKIYDKAPPLIRAIIDQYQKLFNKLLNSDEANRRAENGSLPLHFAAQGGNLEMVKLLLPQTTEGVNVEGDEGSTPLFFAAESGKANVVEYLLNNGADANIPDAGKRVPLHVAAQAGDLESVKLLLPKTTDGINVKENYDYTPLFFAAESGKANVVEYLLNNGADANIPDAGKRVPLHVAAQTGDMESVKLLLPKTTGGINFKGNDNYTPLFFAAESSKANVVKYLLDNGADANIDCYGDLPLHVAVQAGDLESAKLLLPKTKGGMNVKGDWDMTPLFFAAQKGKANIVEYLLNNGADANIQDSYKDFPLHTAAEIGDIGSIKLLVRKTTGGVNTKGHMEKTPLSIAVRKGHVDAVKWLLENGADATTLDADGNLPIAYAKNAQIFALLNPKK
jgi:ankyrin repeat protein